MEYDKAKTANRKTDKERKPRIPRRISETYLHNAGLYYLERFSASSGQFRTVMRRKIIKSSLHHTDQNITDCHDMLEKTIVKFLKSGLLDDEVYARSVITTQRRRGLSARAIEARLRTKHVPSELITKYMAEYEGDDFIAALRQCRRKRMGAFCTKVTDDPQKLFNKYLSRLARAGFSYSIAKSALEMDLDEAEEKLLEIQ